MVLSPSCIERLKLQHHSLTEMIEELNQTHLSFRIEEDKWSIHENIAHLGRYQEVFLMRIEQILSNTVPSFHRYQAEWDEGSTPWMRMDTQEVIHRLLETRRMIIQQLTGLSEQQFKMRGRHPKLGIMDIPTWTEHFLLHEAHHLYTIFKLKQVVINE